MPGCSRLRTIRNFLPPLRYNSKFSEESIDHISVSFQLCHLQPGIGDAHIATRALSMCDENGDVGRAIIQKLSMTRVRGGSPLCNQYGYKNVLSQNG